MERIAREGQDQSNLRVSHPTLTSKSLDNISE